MQMQDLSRKSLVAVRFNVRLENLRVLCRQFRAESRHQAFAVVDGLHE